MREIKFRGKRIDNGEWVYGLYVKSANDMTYIIIYATEDAVNTGNEIDFLYTDVIPETTGQYTGLKDKNDVEIYEGDICKFTVFNSQRVGAVIFNEEKCRFEVLTSLCTDWSLQVYEITDLEVTGNIHDQEETI